MSDEEPELDLNALMSKDPLGLTDQDLDRIIAKQRQARTQRESGVRTKKDTGGAGATVDIKALMSQIQKGPGPVVVKAVPKETVTKPPSKSGFIRRL